MSDLKTQLRDSVDLARLQDAIRDLAPGDWVMFDGDTRPEVIGEIRGRLAFFRSGGSQFFADVSEIIEVRKPKRAAPARDDAGGNAEQSAFQDASSTPDDGFSYR